MRCVVSPNAELLFFVGLVSLDARILFFCLSGLTRCTALVFLLVSFRSMHGSCFLVCVVSHDAGLLFFIGLISLDARFLFVRSRSMHGSCFFVCPVSLDARILFSCLSDLTRCTDLVCPVSLDARFLFVRSHSMHGSCFLFVSFLPIPDSCFLFVSSRPPVLAAI